jgi:dienelactone hydrolase
MITRRYLIGSALAAATSRLRGADPIGYREYSRCLPDYLGALAEGAYRRRSERIAKLTTPASIRQYQTWARETFLKIAGPLPERTPLNVRTVGGFERERYRVEKLVYESRPGVAVAANLYLPKQSGPHPGVLFQMGHTNNGKGGSTYQRCCQGLVQLGYLVLAFDPMGQGERTNYAREGGWLTRLGSADDEHTTPGRQMLLTGETATGMQLWDAIRSLDLLESHPLVDRKRLASTGQSGGATITMLLAAADPRLGVVAVSSGNTENFATSPFLAPGSTDDAEQDLVGSAPLGFDRWDLLWPVAPKPLLIGTSARDFFGTYSPSYESSGRAEFARLSRAYSVLGASEKLQHVETPLPHGLSYSLRVAIYDWFEKHLKSSGQTITEEPPTKLETDEMLWCGPTGNVVRDFGGKSVSTLIRERAATIRTPESLADLRALLQMDAIAAPTVAVKAKTRYGDCDISAVEVNSAPHVWLPAWLFLPKREWTRLLLLLEPNGRNGQWHEDELYPRLAAAGIAVCAADVRGTGDLQPAFSPGAAGYTREHQNEENYAWASLILGRSLLGQRVTDIMAITAALASSYPRANVAVAARDKLTVPALCAAALEPRIQKLYLSRHLVSWRSIAETERYSQPLANFVPDVLRHTDLPQIAHSIAPRPVMVAGATDAAGGLLREAPYSDYREEPRWDFDVLSQL